MTWTFAFFKTTREALDFIASLPERAQREARIEFGRCAVTVLYPLSVV